MLGNDIEEEITLLYLTKYHNEHMASSLSHNTIKHYETTERYLKRFLKQKKKTSDIFLRQINYKFIIDFESFLRNWKPIDHKRPMNNNGVMKHMTRLRKLMNLAMTFLLIFLLIETTTLFVRQLPDDIPLFWRVVASIAIAFAFEFTVLIFTTNSDHTRKGIKPQHVLVCFHLVINTFFWQVFEFADWVDLGYKLFLSFLFPYLIYQYAALFERKFREKKDDDMSTLDKLSQLAARYKSAHDHIKSSYDELKSNRCRRKYDSIHVYIQYINDFPIK